MLRAKDHQDLHSEVANYLLILSRGSDYKVDNNSDEYRRRRVFKCKTCDRQFSSFQALGGHRASHKRQRPAGAELNLASQLETELAKPKLHECSICGLEFAIGQALGGHMRRHKGQVAIPKLVPKTRRFLCLDLNLTPYENDLNFSYN